MTIWEVFVWMFWFYVVVACLLIFFTALFDVFRDPGLNGWAKAFWVVLLVLFPFLGVLVYVIVRGRSMSERGLAASRRG